MVCYVELSVRLLLPMVTQMTVFDSRTTVPLGSALE